MGDFLDKTGLARVKAKIDTALATKLNVSLKGVANGVAELDANGYVPSSQLPLMIGSTSHINGRAGLVPAPPAGDENSFLRSDGTWMEIYTLPDPPIIDGTYTLQCFASDGSIYYQWVLLFNAEGESF